MKSIYWLPLAILLACDAPLVPTTDEPMVQVHTFPGVPGWAEDGNPLDRMEYRIPGHMLPALSPRIELDQGRWETIRQGKDWPRSVVEREALGMDVQSVCSNSERCDNYANCDGTDTDGLNVDGVDFTEYPVWSIGSVAGWSNCEVNNSMPNRCNGHLSGHLGYNGAQCPGCNVMDFLQVEFLSGSEVAYFFMGDNNSGECVRFRRTSSCAGGEGPGCMPGGAYGDPYTLTFANLQALHGSLNDNITSWRFTGHGRFPYSNSGAGSLELWGGNVGDWFNEVGCWAWPGGPYSPCTIGVAPVSGTAAFMNNKTSSIRLNFANAN